VVWNSIFQEAGSRIHEIFFHQFPLGFLPVVLFGWRPVWLFSVSNIRVESMEELVSLSFHFTS